MTSIAEKYAAQYQPNGEVSLADLIQAAVDEAQSVPVLSVWYGAMPETNGRSNWTALLHNGDFSTGFTVARSEYPDRVRYEADRVRYLIGELKDEPFILDYDAEKHSGYVEARSVAVVGDVVERKDPYDFALDWRMIDRMTDGVCDRCGGSGIAVYGDSSTWRRGIGGQSITSDVCDVCWGSGLHDRPWPSRRAQTSISATELDALRKDAENWRNRHEVSK